MFVCFPKQIQLNTSKRVSSPGEILAKRLGGGSWWTRQLRGMWREARRGEPPFSCWLQRAYFFPDYLKDYSGGDREKRMSLKQKKQKNNRLLRKRKNEFVDGRFHGSILKPAENLHYSSAAFWCFPYYIVIWLFSFFLHNPGSYSFYTGTTSNKKKFADL